MSAEESREPIEVIGSELALAVQLVDEYTGRPLPTRQMRSVAAQSARARRGGRAGTTTDLPAVSIRGIDATPVVNPSGFLLYFREDFPEDPEEIEIEVAGGGQYTDERASVDLADHDRQEPKRIELQPLPAYQFPTDTTLVRGYVLVIDEEVDDEDLVTAERFGEGGVKLEIEGLGAATETVKDGEFVLSITGLTANDVEDGLVKVNGGDPVLELELEHDEFEGASVPIEVAEGETRCYQIKFDVNEDERVMYRKCGTEPWGSPPV